MVFGHFLYSIRGYSARYHNWGHAFSAFQVVANGPLMLVPILVFPMLLAVFIGLRTPVSTKSQTALNTALSESQDQRAQDQQRIKSLDESIGAATAKLETVATENSALESELSALRQSLSQAEEAREEALQVQTSLSDSLQEMQANLESAQARFAEQAASAEESKSQVSLLQANLE